MSGAGRWALRGSCAGRGSVWWRSWGQFRTGRGKRGPAAVARHPTDLLLHWFSFWRHTCGLPNGKGGTLTPTSCRTTPAFMSPFSTGLPDTQYVVSIALQRAIGTFTTNDAGNGATNIDAPGVTTGLFGDPNWFVDVRVNNTWDDYRVAGPFVVQ